MKPHKWEKEIKAWASGAEIEQKIGETWHQVLTPSWHRDTEYRIKPQPKEPQYLYVYGDKMTGNAVIGLEFLGDYQDLDYSYQGKIKLETDDGA